MDGEPATGDVGNAGQDMGKGGATEDHPGNSSQAALNDDVNKGPESIAAKPNAGLPKVAQWSPHTNSWVVDNAREQVAYPRAQMGMYGSSSTPQLQPIVDHGLRNPMVYQSPQRLPVAVQQTPSWQQPQFERRQSGPNFQQQPFLQHPQQPSYFQMQQQIQQPQQQQQQRLAPIQYRDAGVAYPRQQPILLPQQQQSTPALFYYPQQHRVPQPSFAPPPVTNMGPAMAMSQATQWQ